MARTMSWRNEGRLNVVFHGTRSPTNLEWQSYVIDSVSLNARPDTRVVVLSRGGSPDGHQRQALITAFKGRPSPVALLTDNLLARAAISAMRIWNPSMRAFATGALKEAGEFLGLVVAERERVAELLVVLEAEVGEGKAAAPPTRTTGWK
jgi:hypothetical protein